MITNFEGAATHMPKREQMRAGREGAAALLLGWMLWGLGGSTVLPLPILLTSFINQMFVNVMWYRR